MNNKWVKLALAVAALFVGGIVFGWKGVVLVMTALIFWLLLEFSKLMRLMGMASKGPMGRVQSAEALNASLRAGLKLVDVLPLTGSLGQKVADTPPTYAWSDAGGARVEVVLMDGKVASWTLTRTA